VDQVTAMLAGNLQIGVWDIVVLTVLSLPPLFVLFSKRVEGSSKVWWFVLTSVFSWLAYVPFLLMAPKRKDGGEPPAKGGA
jgi:hypothetical protein